MQAKTFADYGVGKGKWKTQADDDADADTKSDRKKGERETTGMTKTSGELRNTITAMEDERADGRSRTGLAGKVKGSEQTEGHENNSSSLPSSGHGVRERESELKLVKGHHEKILSV